MRIVKVSEGPLFVVHERDQVRGIAQGEFLDIVENAFDTLVQQIPRIETGCDFTKIHFAGDLQVDRAGNVQARAEALGSLSDIIGNRSSWLAPSSWTEEARRQRVIVCRTDS
jgi:hypothetical protein